MLFGYYGLTTTPDDVQGALSMHQGYWGDTRNLVDWRKLPAIYPAIKAVTVQDFAQRDPAPAEMNDLYDELLAGRPAILKVDGNPATVKLDEHFVLARGVLEGGIVVADPWSAEYKPLTDFCLTSKPWRKTEAAATWKIIKFEMDARQLPQ